MSDSCEVHLMIRRADFTALGFGDKRWLHIDGKHGDILEVSGEFTNRAEELRDQMDAASIVYLGSYGGSANHGSAAFASDGDRSLDHATDQDGSYLVPADSEGVVSNSNLVWLREFIAFRKSVAAKLGLCMCCELPLEKCRSSGR